MRVSDPALQLVSPTGLLYRVGRRPEPWGWVPWQYGPFTGGRYDDPAGLYRVLYAGTSPEACFVEVLAPFRPDPHLVEVLAALTVDEDADADYPTRPPGLVPTSWLTARQLASAAVPGRFVDVRHKLTIAALRPALIGVALRLGLPDFDAAAIRLARPRALTQALSRHVYDGEEADGPLAGICYESRHGAALELWALFERTTRQAIDVREVADLTPDTPGLAAALRLHGLELEA